MRPSNFTGGASAGWTVTTAISAPRNTHFPTVNDGGGSVLPSLRMSANVTSSLSSMVAPEGVPSSRAPMNRTPGRPWAGRSLANAQTAWRAFSATSPTHACLRSQRSDSMSSSRASSSAMLSALIGLCPWPGAYEPGHVPRGAFPGACIARSTPGPWRGGVRRALPPAQIPARRPARLDWRTHAAASGQGASRETDEERDQARRGWGRLFVEGYSSIERSSLMGDEAGTPETS